MDIIMVFEIFVFTNMAITIIVSYFIIILKHVILMSTVHSIK